jgi:hypothetical protein
MVENIVARTHGRSTEDNQNAIWFVQSESPWRTAAWVVFTLGMCLYFALAYSSIMDYLDLNLYMQGLEKIPYQHRVLMMWVFQLLATQHVTLSIAQHAQHMHVPPGFGMPQQLVQLVVAMLCLFVAVLATAGTLTRLTGDRIFSRWMSLLVIYMAYFTLAPGWGLRYTFPYDVPSLMFFCIGAYLTVSERDWLYYVVYPIAVLNRETICFLTVFFLIWKWQELKSRADRVTWRQTLSLVAHGAAQAAIWIAVRLWISHRFATNPVDYGTFGPRPAVVILMEKLKFNIHEILLPQQWPVYLSIFGFLLPVLWLQRRWIRNQGIYWGCAIVIPLWFIGMLLVGLIPEIRIFSELTSLLVPALALIVYHRFVPAQRNIDL